MPERKKILALSRAVLEDISQNNLSTALDRIKNYVLFMYDEDLCTGHLFGIELLDELCQKIGQASLAINISEYPVRDEFLSKEIRIYLISRFQRSGGHSRVLEAEFKNNLNCKHIVLSTELAGKSDYEYIKDHVLSSSVEFDFCKQKSSYSKLNWLQNKLLSFKGSKVFVFNHHFDSVIISASQPSIVSDGYYYHHADHHLALGLFLNYLKHIDPHPMGYINCRHNLGIDNNYVPLNVPDIGQYDKTKEFKRNGILTTCTAARANKVSVPYVLSYFDVILNLLDETDGRHVHIGWLPLWTRLHFALKMREKNITQDRFVYIPWVKNIAKELKDREVDLYISSFPYTGALTLIEVASTGIPIAIHQHYSSSFLSCAVMFDECCFLWREVNVLIDFCKNANSQQLKKLGDSARIHYANNYMLRHDLTNSMKVGFDLNPEKEQIPIAWEYYIWLVSQVSLLPVFSKEVKKRIRFLKQLLG